MKVINNFKGCKNKITEKYRVKRTELTNFLEMIFVEPNLRAKIPLNFYLLPVNKGDVFFE